MNKWLKNQIVKLMEKRDMSISDIEINERFIYDSVPYIEVDFRIVESDIFFTGQVIINTEKDSFEDILNDIELEIESFLKQEGIA